MWYFGPRLLTSAFSLPKCRRFPYTYLTNMHNKHLFFNAKKKSFIEKLFFSGKDIKREMKIGKNITKIPSVVYYSFIPFENKEFPPSWEEVDLMLGSGCAWV